MAERGTDFSEITLTNVGDGELERQFGECVLEVVQALGERHEYEPVGGRIKAKIGMTVEFELHLETNAILVGVRANYAPPKRRAALRAAFIKDGVVLVEAAEQLPLPTDASKVTPIRPEAEGEAE